MKVRTHKNCRFSKKVRKDNKKYYAFDGLRCTNPNACVLWIDVKGACYYHKFNYNKV